MERPLEIVFHNMPPSVRMERLVREKLEKLEKLNHHIIGCRVALEKPRRPHKPGEPPVVHVEIQVPGHTLVVRHRHANGRRTSSDAGSSIRDAFNAAAEKLLALKRKKRKRTEPE